MSGFDRTFAARGTLTLVPLPPYPVTACVVGSTNVDLVLHVERLPRAGETVLATARQRLPGGKGANQAVALARLGAGVRLCSAVGDDDDGTWSLRQLEADGVDCSDVLVCPDVPTGVAVVTVDRSGENAIVVVAGANQRVVAPDHVDEDVLLLSLEVPMATVVEAAGRAGKVVCNAAPYRPLPPELLNAVDVLVVNEHEAELLAGTAYDGDLVVTMGGRGALVRTDGRSIQVPAPVVDVVDTTGAGDCFAAALALGVGGGHDLVTAARTAVVAASLSVGARGARGGVPSASELSAAEVE
jgi:ribokinase